METSNSGGYTLDQLLEWCTHDRLIEGYDKLEDSVVIFENGSRHEFDVSAARRFLKGMFTSTHRDTDGGDRNLA